MNILNYEGLSESNNADNEGFIIGETSGVDFSIFRSAYKIALLKLDRQISILNTYSSSQDRFWTQTFYKKAVNKLIEAAFNEIFDTQFPVFMPRITSNVPIYTRSCRTYLEMLSYITRNHIGVRYSNNSKFHKINRNSKVLMHKSYFFLITSTEILPLGRLVINKENFLKYLITSLNTEDYLRRLGNGRFVRDISELVSNMDNSRIKDLTIVNLEINKSILYTKQYNLSKFRTSLEAFVNEERPVKIQEVENLDFIKHQKKAKFQSIQHQKDYFEDFEKSFNNHVTFSASLSYDYHSMHPLAHMLL